MAKPLGFLALTALLLSSLACDRTINEVRAPLSSPNANAPLLAAK